MSKELNKAPVEQAGGDERAAFEKIHTVPRGIMWNEEKSQYVRVHEKHCSLRTWNSFVALWAGWMARAALAQPSPAQAEQAEAERPEVVGYLATAEHPKHGQPHKALNYFKDQHDAQVAHWRERGCEVSEDELMAVAQHERIVASRWERAMDLMGEHVARISEKLTAERDAALAKVAGLELKLDQSDYAYDNDRCHMRGLAKQAAEAIQVFTGHDSSANLAHRYGEKWWEHLDELRDALLAFAKNAPVAQPEEMPGEILAAKLIETWVTKHGKPAPWSTAVEITAVATNMPNDERDRLLALDDDVDAQAQHSVPEEFIGRLSEFLAQRGATGKALLRELRTVLASAPGKEGNDD
ncbi:TPA: hypothetical protein VDT58_001983 [Pseudomonas aeruginosa]|nr:hypothetical protein [Pseudomonas aeruginosa]